MLGSWDFDKKRRIAVNGDAIKYRLKDVAVKPGSSIALKKNFDPAFTGGFTDKGDAIEHLARNRNRLAQLQETLYADGRYSVLVILQGMDASGKDGAIRHIMSGVNPQGCNVTSFKAPSTQEIDHTFLWRVQKALPARGMIGIFNRSHYEETLVVRVHEDILGRQKLPPEARGKNIWKDRYEDINTFERHLERNGTIVMKFFLNISYDEQRRRFIERIDEPDKHWKFNAGDVKERGYWKQYQKAYEDMLEATSTKWAPWWVVPADNKWFARLMISEIIAMQLEMLDIAPPKVSTQTLTEMLVLREQLLKD
ncbi:MAG: polyphosphate kinase 2 family protein [Beijerinckiaceae bacterium]|nr:polyphosphate kinase 2 family protein [Beijerinckiaceae bacterium]